MNWEKELIGERTTFLEAILNRETGASWQEANTALQQIMWDYAGNVRSETLLDQGTRNLHRLKEKVIATLTARNGHELGRCLETINLLDVGEAVMLCARGKKFTGGSTTRADFPFTNPLLDKSLYIAREGDSPVFEWG